jgi:PadR family transcriptional regulator PadR
MPTESLGLLQGTLDVLVLRTLALGPMHGFGVSRSIRERTRGTIDIEDGPLYKALHRLEHDGNIVATWGTTENNRRARYYALTPQGRKSLRSEEANWRRYVAAVSMVLEPA